MLMSVNIRSVFSDGWKDVKNNPILFVPNALFSISLIILLFSFIAVSTLIFFEDAVLTYPNNGIVLELLPNLIGEAFIVYLLTFLLVGLVLFLLSIYLQTGLIGMTYDAAKTGKTSLSKMFFYGNKYFLRFLSASFLVLLNLFLPAFILFLLIFAGGLLSSSFSNAADSSFFILFAIGFVFYLVYLFIASVYLYFVLHAIIIDDLSAIEGILKSISLFKQNKKDVFIFFLIMFAVFIMSLILTSAFNSLSSIPISNVTFNPGSFLWSVFKSVFLSTFVTVWATRMYLALTRNGCCYGCLDEENGAGCSDENCEEQNADTDF